MKHGLSLLALAAALAITPAAKAGSFDFTFTDGTTADITYTLGSYDSSTGLYALTDASITLTCSSEAAAGSCVSTTSSLADLVALTTAGTYTYFADNELTSSYQIDSSGLLFEDGTNFIHVYNFGDTYILSEVDTCKDWSYSTTATPEPSSFLLLASGFFGLMFFVSRKHGMFAFLK